MLPDDAFQHHIRVQEDGEQTFGLGAALTSEMVKVYAIHFGGLGSKAEAEQVRRAMEEWMVSTMSKQGLSVERPHIEIARRDETGAYACEFTVHMSASSVEACENVWAVLGKGCFKICDTLRANPSGRVH